MDSWLFLSGWKNYAKPINGIRDSAKLSAREFIHTPSTSRILRPAACLWERVCTTGIQASVAPEPARLVSKGELRVSGPSCARFLSQPIGTRRQAWVRQGAIASAAHGSASKKNYTTPRRACHAPSPTMARAETQRGDGEARALEPTPPRIVAR